MPLPAFGPRTLSVLIISASTAALALSAACSSDEAPAASSGDAADGAAHADASGSSDSSNPTGDVDGASHGDASTDAGDAGPPPCPTATPCAVHLVAGVTQTCVIMSDKTVRCWGSNGQGQLGQPLPGDGGPGEPVLRPVPVNGVTNVRAMSLGAGHACALLESGAVSCWGSNQYSQLAMAADGGGVFTNLSSTPVNVPVTGTAVEISSGFYHTCIRRADGTAQCWGYNSHAQIGAVSADGGSLGDFVPAPTNTLLTGIAQLDVGGRFACGLLTDGGVSCWGHDDNGQLGRGGPPFGAATDPHPAPVVGLPATVVHVGRSVGYSEGVILTDKTVRVWGWNSSGQLGPGTDAGATGTPLAVPGLSDVNAVGFGLQNACALMGNGTVACWGATADGIVGVPTDAGAKHPVPNVISGVANAVELAVGWNDFACALEKDGVVVCWGSNTAGQLGRGVSSATLANDMVAAPVTF